MFKKDLQNLLCIANGEKCYDISWSIIQSICITKMDIINL